MIFLTLLPSAKAVDVDVEINNQFFAGRFALLMSRVTKPSDLSSFLSWRETDLNLINREIRSRNKVGFAQPRIHLEKKTVELVFPERKVRVNFEHFEEGYVSLEGERIKFETFKTILNYQAEVKVILNRKKYSKVGFYLLPPAEARSLSEAMDWISLQMGVGLNAIGYGSGVNGIKSIGGSRTANLEANIIRAYENDLIAFERSKDEPLSENYLPVTFVCRNGKLEKLGKNTLAFFGTNRLVQEIKVIQALPNNRFSFSRIERNGSDAILDSSFNVISSTNSTMKVGSNLSESMLNSHGGFPPIAQRCCAKRGCYETVSRAWAPNLRRASETQRSSQ